MREYKTQMEAAKKGIVTSEMKTVAEKEGLDPDVIRQRTAAGTGLLFLRRAFLVTFHS